MLAKWKQLIEMFLRVQYFLGANPPPASAACSVQKQILDDLVARLTGHTQAQSAGTRLSRQETRRQAALRKQLREEILAPLAKIARAHRDVPGLDKAMRAPKPGIATTRLIQEADGIRGAIAGQAQVFLDSGQPEDFLDKLDAAIGELRRSLVGQAANTGVHIGARTGMKQEIRLGRKTVDILDTIVSAAFRGQLDVLAKWNAAKRVRRTGSGTTPVVATGGTVDENLPPAPALSLTPPNAEESKAA